MIGKANWFRRRKYTGWGFTPVTWQGWMYILVLILPVIIIAETHAFRSWQVVFLVAWAVIFIIDAVDIMIHLPKDERDRTHEAIAERNALWIIVAILGVGIAYQVSIGVVANNIAKVDPVIIIALFAGLLVKIVSNVYLDKKN